MVLNPAAATGQNIRAEMARRGVTQMQLAAYMRLSQTSVSKRLRGATPFRIDELYAVAGLLGVSPTSLLPDAVAA